MPSITRAYDAQSAVDRAERTIVATINTLAVDRYKTVIMPEGAQLDNYRRNPVVLYNHDGTSFPIGKNLWTKIANKRLVAKTKFLPEGKDEIADKVFDLYDLGFLNAWSISFDPIDAGAPTADEIRKRPELAECGRIFRTWDLLEYSCVTVPGNPEACRQAVARGIALPGWSTDPPNPSPGKPELPLPPLVGRSLDQVLAAVTRGLVAETSDLQSRASRDAYELAKGMV